MNTGLAPTAGRSLIWLLAVVLLAAIVAALDTGSNALLVFSAIVVAAPASAILIWAAVARPGMMLAFTLLITIFVPIEVATKFGDLPRIGPTRLFLGIFIIGWSVRCLLRKTLQPKFLQQAPRSAILAFSGVAILSLVFSVDPLTSMYFLLDQFGVVFFFFLLFVFLFEYNGNWILVKRTLYFGATIVCSLALVEATTGYNPIVPFLNDLEQPTREGFIRVRATFYHPIALGAFINLIAPFMLADVLTERTASKHRIMIVLLSAMIVVQFLTLSRMAWICLVLEFGVVGILYKRPTIRQTLLIVACTGMGLVTLVAVYESIDFVFRLFHPILHFHSMFEDSSEYYRLAVVKAVLASLDGARWIVGHGPGTFHVAGITSDYAGARHILTAPDLHYARVLADFGLLGLGTFVALLISVIVVCARATTRAKSETRPDAAASLAVVLGFVALNATVSMFYTLPLALIFWAAVARSMTLRAAELQAEFHVSSNYSQSPSHI